MNTQLKRRVAFALLMGVVTTGIISLVFVAPDAELSTTFLLVWLRAWGMAYVIVIPAILLIGPPLQAQIDRRVR
jgi:Protein of unknown function (DUF2798)